MGDPRPLRGSAVCPRPRGADGVGPQGEAVFRSPRERRCGGSRCPPRTRPPQAATRSGPRAGREGPVVPEAARARRPGRSAPRARGPGPRRTATAIPKATSAGRSGGPCRDAACGHPRASGRSRPARRPASLPSAAASPRGSHSSSAQRAPRPRRASPRAPPRRPCSGPVAHVEARAGGHARGPAPHAPSSRMRAWARSRRSVAAVRVFLGDPHSPSGPSPLRPGLEVLDGVAPAPRCVSGGAAAGAGPFGSPPTGPGGGPGRAHGAIVPPRGAPWDQQCPSGASWRRPPAVEAHRRKIGSRPSVRTGKAVHRRGVRVPVASPEQAGPRPPGRRSCHVPSSWSARIRRTSSSAQRRKC